MSYGNLMPLRYPAECRVCGEPIESGTTGYWDRSAKRATCIGCAAERPADPFATLEPELQGTAGGSAQAEYERRRARHGSGHHVDSWQKGAVGERRLSERLHDEAGRGHLVILDDVQIPGSRANIDHIVVAPSGVFVVDAKNYKGRVTRKVEGVLKWRTERLFVNGRNQTKLVDGMAKQVAAVHEALSKGNGDRPAVMPVLCFLGEDNWPLFDAETTVNGVAIVGPRVLIKRLRKDGPLDGAARTRIARLLSMQLRPAA